MFFLMENARLSDRLEAAAPAAACIPPSEARAGRLKKFRREQLIVDYLNRGVSIAEIAARVGVGEKRTRAVIRDPRTGIRGCRRMPHPPEPPDPSPGVVAIQLNRLNEALLVAFSAMSPTNLKAVDQVVKIVRELDRYGGAFAAEWARPEASRRDAPAEEDAAFAGRGSMDRPAGSAGLAIEEFARRRRRALRGRRRLELASARGLRAVEAHVAGTPWPAKARTASRSISK